MERKTIIIIITLVLVIVICSFIPFTNKREVLIKAHLYDVAKQINDLNNWKYWNADFKNNDIEVSGSFNHDQVATVHSKRLYALHHINPLIVSFTRVINETTTASLITLSSSLNNDSLTNISWIEDVTIFKLIKRNITKENSRLNSLNNLKQLLENSNRRYGYLIKIIPVKDTLILTAESTTQNSLNAILSLYKELQLFIQEHKLPAEKKYFYTTQLSNNKIAVGIPVYKELNNTDNIKFLQLPRSGKLVEGIYSGKDAGKKDIYAAMNNFILDQHLKQVAQPFEQYNISDTLLQPNSYINIKIYYPVF